MDPDRLRQIERWCGLAAGLFGVILPTYAFLFGGGRGTPENASIILVLAALAVVVAVAALIDSYAHDLGATIGSLALLYAATAVWIALLLVPFGNLGLYSAPAAIFAVAAAASATLAHQSASTTT